MSLVRLVWRFLVAWPDSLMGHRLYSEKSVYDAPEYERYADRIVELLEGMPKTRELAPADLTLDAEAKAEYIAFANECETGLLGAFRAIHGFACRAAEHALRIAGVLTMVADPQATTVDLTSMRGGIRLARWYLNECLRLSENSLDDPDLMLAEELLDWIRERVQETGSPVPTRDVYQRGPSGIRNADKARQILGILAQHGWVHMVSQRPETWALTNET